MKFLVTGAAGFIGSNVCKRLLSEGHEVVGVDNLDPYYDVEIKKARISDLILDSPLFLFRQNDISKGGLGRIAIETNGFDFIIHLAAQAGVRHSIANPMAYIHSNLVGFQHVIELARKTRPINFVYASSSSVYGGNTPPFDESMSIQTPQSLYAATKVSNEMVAHSYGQMYGLESTGLRFHTVYGPNGRPDMLFRIAIEKIMKGKPIDLFWEDGAPMRRDFTYIDDIVDGIVEAAFKPEVNQVYNLAGGKCVDIEYALELIEECMGKQLERRYTGKQVGDIEQTASGLDKAKAGLGYAPKVGLEVGIRRMCEWHKAHP